uniref:Uncharacterized protein n=1 Tax=viral metagenome TaxID=1070528 RepID=A0A6M3JEE7_9ZZZZ
MVKIILTIVLMFCFIIPAYCHSVPMELYKGIIAEDTSGDYQVYLAIASVVHNRLQKGMTIGLVALNRQDLDNFINQEYWYAKTKGVDLIKISTQAIKEVFYNNIDTTNGATNYEHTGVYPVPKYTRIMQICKIMFMGTKKEITFWREK